METQSRQTLTEALKALQSNPENPEAVLSDFEAQIARREQKISKLRSEAVALREIVNGMRGLLGQPAMPDASTAAKAAGPGPPSPTADLRPEGMEAVRRIMKDGGVWTASQVLEEMKRRGWESRTSDDPLRPAEAAINRLWKVKREVERVGRGQYQYVGASAPEGQPGSDRNFLNGGSGS
jgi:hypothetical protein